MVNQAVGLTGATVVHSLLKRIQNEVCRHAAGGAPADNPYGIRDDNKGHIQPSLTSGKWSNRPDVVELTPSQSSPKRNCTSQLIRLFIQALLIARTTAG